MSITDPTGTVGATIDVAHLPGVTYEVLARLAAKANALEATAEPGPDYGDATRDTVSEALTALGRCEVYRSLLETLAAGEGQVVGDREFLRELFEDIAEDSREAIQSLSGPERDLWLDADGAERNYSQALAGAEQVLGRLQAGHDREGAQR